MSDLVQRLRDTPHDEWCSINLDDAPKCDCLKLEFNEAADEIERLTAERDSAVAQLHGWQEDYDAAYARIEWCFEHGGPTERCHRAHDDE